MCQQQERVLNLNFPALQDVLDVGVRRASSFIALGLRVSIDETVRSLELDANFQIMFMPRNPPIEVVRDAQRNFATWIIGNGLRELDQSASIFADRVFEIGTLVQFNNRQVPQASIDRIANFRRQTNVANKLQTIADEFGVGSNLREHMPRLSKARNALSHNRGFIDHHHATDDGMLRLTWVGLELAAGDCVIAGPFEPVRVAAGEHIKIRLSRRERDFAIGTSVELSAHDLAEICFTYQQLGNQVCQALEGHFRELGIEGPAPQ